MLAASSFSDAEKALNLCRQLRGETAQNIVFNIFNIMFIGRDKNLSNCDFSFLDLKKCNLKGGIYTEWYNDDIYPSSFEHSSIDLESFISSGHTAAVSAICEGMNGLFSADTDGSIRHWNYEKTDPDLVIDTQGSAIIGLSYSESQNKLAILKQHSIYSYDIITGKLIQIANSKNTYRYIRYTDDEPEITYDTEPLIWLSISGRKKYDYLENDIPCGCSIINSFHSTILRSYLFGSIHKYDVQTNELCDELDLFKTANGAGITDMQYSIDETRFLVGFGKYLFEFDSKSLSQIHMLEFKSSVKSVLYTRENKIIAAVSTSIMVLNKDFSLYKEFTGESLPNIIKTLDNDGELHFLDTTGTIKHISGDMRVYRTRKPWFKPMAIAFGEFGNGNKHTTMFMITNNKKLSKDSSKKCVGYDFNKNYVYEINKEYEIFNLFYENEQSEYEIYKLANKIIAINKKTSESILFVNYKGITIYGCNFKDISGSLSSPDGLHFLLQNGGIINE
ncbi:MAG: WD40 repeat domain-containing protein [Oscillospiraceae bacterium]|nr:WD40 repeat domain-containing protein [Oscillospiraceae bacterium]